MRCAWEQQTPTLMEDHLSDSERQQPSATPLANSGDQRGAVAPRAVKTVPPPRGAALATAQGFAGIGGLDPALIDLTSVESRRRLLAAGVAALAAGRCTST